MKKDLAALYPPYDKVTRGDVIAGRLKGMKGKMKGKKEAMKKKAKKKKLQKEWSVYHQMGIHLAEALGIVAEQKNPKPKKSKPTDVLPKEMPTAKQVGAGMYKGK
jgi:hypothetical protein